MANSGFLVVSNMFLLEQFGDILYSVFHVHGGLSLMFTLFGWLENKMKPTNPNAHTYVNGTDVKTHGYAVTHNIFLQ